MIPHHHHHQIAVFQHYCRKALFLLLSLPFSRLVSASDRCSSCSVIWTVLFVFCYISKLLQQRKADIFLPKVVLFLFLSLFSVETYDISYIYDISLNSRPSCKFVSAQVFDFACVVCLFIKHVSCVWILAVVTLKYFLVFPSLTQMPGCFLGIGVTASHCPFQAVVHKSVMLGKRVLLH
jgi:hypothetical protein